MPEPTQLRARALYAAGYMTFLQGDAAAALALLEESAAISRDLRDKLGLAHASYLLGAALAFGGNQEGQAINAEGVILFRQLGAEGKPGLVLGLMTAGMLSFLQGDYSAARSTFEECRALSREVGDSYGLAQASNYLGDMARIECDYPRAGSFYEESLPLFQDQGGTSDIPAILHNLGYVALAQNDYPKAEALFKESQALQQEIGNKQGISECLTGFGAIAGAQGDPTRAARLFGASEALRSAIGVYMWPAERIEWERHVESARAQVGKADWDRAWQEGAAMTVEAAIAFALHPSG